MVASWVLFMDTFVDTIDCDETLKESCERTELDLLKVLSGRTWQMLKGGNGHNKDLLCKSIEPEA